MELDELKSQLKSKLATDHAGRSDADIATLLTKKTSSVVGKLKRSLWIEIWSCIAISLGFGYFGIFSNYHWVRIYFSVFAVLCVGFLILLVYLLRRITLLNATSLPVKGNLQTIVTIIEEFTKRYFQFTMALIPICFIFSLLLGFNEPKHDPEIDRFAKSFFSATWQVIIFIIVYMTALSVGIYYFTKWYLLKLYGKYINQLKICIADLSEE